MAQGPTGGRSRTRNGVAFGLATAAMGLASTFAAAGVTIGTTVAPAQADDAKPSYQGTELKAGDTIQQAPQVGTGVYVMDAPTDDKASSFVTINRAIPGSTLWFGATFDPGTDLTIDQATNLQLGALPDGSKNDDCLFGDNLATDGSDSPGLQTVLYRLTEEADCRAAKSITMEFSPYEVDFPEGTQIQIVVWEEPPVDDVSGMPAGSSTVTWSDMGPGSSSPTEITPGTTWSDSPDVSQGTFKVHLDPDTTNVFRMPLDWGQHAQLAVSSEQAIDDYDAEIQAFWAGPMGGAIDVAEPLALPPGLTSSLGGLNSGDPHVAFATPVVTYRSRELKGEYGDAPAQLGVPGNYYFVVSLGSKGIPKDGLDVTLQTGFYTDFAVGAPAYRQPPTAMPQSFAGDDTAGAEGDTEAQASEGTPWPVITMLGGGAVVFAALGAFMLGRSRKGRS